MMLSWLSSVADGVREKFEDLISSAKRCLEFSDTQEDGVRETPTTEEVLDRDSW